MQTVTLGRTGLAVSKLGMGGLFVAGFSLRRNDESRYH